VTPHFAADQRGNDGPAWLQDHLRGHPKISKRPQHRRAIRFCHCHLTCGGHRSHFRPSPYATDLTSVILKVNQAAHRGASTTRMHKGYSQLCRLTRSNTIRVTLRRTRWKFKISKSNNERYKTTQNPHRSKQTTASHNHHVFLLCWRYEIYNANKDFEVTDIGLPLMQDGPYKTLLTGLCANIKAIVCDQSSRSS